MHFFSLTVFASFFVYSFQSQWLFIIIINIIILLYALCMKFKKEKKKKKRRFGRQAHNQTWNSVRLILCFKRRQRFGFIFLWLDEIIILLLLTSIFVLCLQWFWLRFVYFSFIFFSGHNRFDALMERSHLIFCLDPFKRMQWYKYYCSTKHTLDFIYAFSFTNTHCWSFSIPNILHVCILNFEFGLNFNSFVEICPKLMSCIA